MYRNCKCQQRISDTVRHPGGVVKPMVKCIIPGAKVLLGPQCMMDTMETRWGWFFRVRLWIRRVPTISGQLDSRSVPPKNNRVFTLGNCEMAILKFS